MDTTRAPTQHAMTTELVSSPANILSSDRIRREPATLLLCLAFVAIALAIAQPNWSQPPVWDGAMSVYPAATTLVRDDVTIGALLRMPGFQAGGPNAAATSTYTWFVAGLIAATGSLEAALPILHFSSTVLLASIGLGTFLIGRHWLTTRGAFAAAVAVMLFPAMVVQARDIYTDLPITAAAVWVQYFVVTRKLGWAALIAALGATVKPTAGLLALLLIGAYGATWTKRLIAAVPTASIAFLPLAIGAAGGTSGSIAERLSFNGLASLVTLLSMPEVLVMIVVFGRLIVATRAADPKRGDLGVTIRSSALLVFGFLIFFALNPAVTRGFQLLPRYLILILPALCLGLSAASTFLLPRRTALLPCAFIVIFAINQFGILYPHFPFYPYAERSRSYEELLLLQKESFAAFAGLAAEQTVLVDHFTYYRFAYPTGWSDGPPSSMVNLYTHGPLTSESLDHLPDRFSLMIEATYLGGPELIEIRDAAAASQQWTVETVYFERGDAVIEISTLNRLPSS